MDINTGLIAIGAGIAILGGGFSCIGEGLIAMKAMEGIARNPDAAKTIRSTMIMSMAIDETGAIFCLLVSILIIFLLG